MMSKQHKPESGQKSDSSKKPERSRSRRTSWNRPDPALYSGDRDLWRPNPALYEGTSSVQRGGQRPRSAIPGRPEISPPDHPTEREADAVADAFSAGRSTDHTPSAGAANTSALPGLEARLASLGGGSELPAKTRDEMEPHLGRDLESVRVHTDERAAQLAQTVDARAFTVGENIVFDSGEYAPASPAGKRLLAHELTHVVQQRDGLGPVIQRDPKNSPRTERLRRLLRWGDEASCLVLMGELDDEEVAYVLEEPSFKSLAAHRLDNEGMYQAVMALQGNLERSLAWMFYEGTKWTYLQNAIEVLSRDETLSDLAGLRDDFVSVLDNEQMFEAVELIGGTLVEKLRWMAAEGTDYDAIQLVTARSSREQRLTVYDATDLRKLLVSEANDLQMQDYVELLGGSPEQQTAWLEAEGVEIAPPSEQDEAQKKDIDLIVTPDEPHRFGRYAIVAKPKLEAAVPGSTVTYRLHVGDNYRAPTSRYSFMWYAVRGSSYQRIGTGPSVEISWSTPGEHHVLCRVFFHSSSGNSQSTSVFYKQSVITRQQRLDQSWNAPGVNPPAKEPAAKEPDEDAKKRLEEYYAKLADRLQSTEGAERIAVHAAHLAFDSSQVTPLKVFVAHVGTQDRQQVWRLVDITNPADQRLTGDHEGKGYSAAEAIQAAIDTWDQENRYPDGLLRVELPEGVVGRQLRVEFETDKLSYWDSWAQFFDRVGLAAGLAGLGLAGLSAIAPVPGGRVAAGLIVTSMLASTTGASIRIAERRSEGFGGGTQELLDAMTIAGSLAGLLTMGVSARSTMLLRARAASEKIDRAVAIQRLVEVGELAVVVVEGLVMSVDTFQRYQKIMEISDPQERRQAILMLLVSAAFEGALVSLDAAGGVASVQRSLDIDAKAAQGPDPADGDGPNLRKIDAAQPRTPAEVNDPQSKELQRIANGVIDDDVPVFQDNSLTPGSVVVARKTNSIGLVSKIEVWHGPPAKHVDLERFRDDLRVHQDVVLTLKEYRGFGGVLLNIRHWIRLEGGVSSEKWRVERETEKLIEMLRLRQEQIASNPALASDPLIADEIVDLRAQLMDLKADAASAMPGTSYGEIAAVFHNRSELELPGGKVNLDAEADSGAIDRLKGASFEELADTHDFADLVAVRNQAFRQADQGGFQRNPDAMDWTGRHEAAFLVQKLRREGSDKAEGLHAFVAAHIDDDSWRFVLRPNELEGAYTLRVEGNLDRKSENIRIEPDGTRVDVETGQTIREFKEELSREEALDLLLGSGENRTEFGRVYDTLATELDEDVLRKAFLDAMPAKRELRGRTHSDVRAKIRQRAEIYEGLLHLVGAPSGQKLDAAGRRKSHQKLLAVIRGEGDYPGLGPAYKGELVERWYERVHLADKQRDVDYHSQHTVPGSQLESGQKRILDVLETSSSVRETGNGAEIVEIKSGEGAVDGAQLDDLYELVSEKRKLHVNGTDAVVASRLRYVFVDPKGAQASKSTIQKALRKADEDEVALVFEVHHPDGQVIKITPADRDQLDELLTVKKPKQEKR